jgi:putative transposase
MPSRSVPIITDQVYHVFNRSVGSIPIFVTKKDYHRFFESVNYYRFSDPQVRFSFYNRANKALKESILASLYSSHPVVSILAYAFMPNHVHFVLRQEIDDGISVFMSRLQNSYARYFNIKNKRFGSLFQSLFKCVRIESDEQLLHVVRYVHLNPVTSFIVNSVAELQTYPWTSYGSYLSNELYSMVQTDDVLSHFKSIDSFEQFTKDQVEYQRTLAELRHVSLDSEV